MNAVASFRKSSKMEDSTAFLRPTGTAKSCCSDAADGNEIKEADRIPPAKLMTPRQFSRRTTPENTLGWPMMRTSDCDPLAK